MLWKTDERACRALRRELIPPWAAFGLASCGKYLGYLIGPGAGDDSWRDPASKFIGRCRYIRQLGLGFSLSLYLYQVLAVYCMQFVAQLAQVPKWVLKLEKQGLEIITGGPSNRVRPQALSCLDDLAGFHFVVPSLELVCNATIARSALVSVQNWRECAAIMDGGWNDDDRALRPRLASWYEGSMAYALRDAYRGLAALGAIRNSVVVDSKLAEVLEKGSRKVQPRLMQILCPDIANFDPLGFLTAKMERWFGYAQAPRFARRALRVSGILRKSVPSFVKHAVLASWCNAWCTTRRFQEDVRRCYLCDECDGDDRLEHYAVCPFLWAAIPNCVSIASHPRNSERFFLVDAGAEDRIPAIATFIFSAYGSFNLARARNSPLTFIELKASLQERFRTAMQLHRGLGRSVCT